MQQVSVVVVSLVFRGCHHLYANEMEQNEAYTIISYVPKNKDDGSGARLYMVGESLAAHSVHRAERSRHQQPVLRAESWKWSRTV